MDEPLAYLNGRFLPASKVAISPVDAGFVLGAAVAEQVRTFAGRLFRLEDHLIRLEQSLRTVGIDPGLSRAELAAIAEDLVARNHPLLAPGDDLGLSIFVTPGPYPAYAGPAPPEPTVCLHTYPLPFGLWADKYQTGQALATTDVHQVPGACWPRGLKCRSRMHYYLADRKAASSRPGARALLLDHDGTVTEASTANLLVYTSRQGLASPPQQRVLAGISLAVVAQLAGQLGIPFTWRSLTPAQVAAAEEVLLTSTPWCLLPVCWFDGRPVGTGAVGPIFGRLLAAWNELVGLDIARQAQQFAHRGGRLDLTPLGS